MIETITPAVCGSRNRYRVALTLFTFAAVAAAAALGASLGLLGAALGAREAVLAVAIIAAVGAAREAGLVRLSQPQLRLQVPERWHLTLPLPLWASGYGAGLGVGLFTFQPVATFWIACAAAVVLGDPLAAAACFSLYGFGRALMVIVPQRSSGEVTAVVEALARGRPALKRVNAAALAVCAVLLATAPSASAAPVPLGPGNHLDPSVSASVLAYTERDEAGTRVVVRVSDAETYPFADARSPALDGGLVAYADASGVRVVEWRSGLERAVFPGPASRPALDWPWLAYVFHNPDGTRDVRLTNLTTLETRVLTRWDATVDVGRPALSAGRVAWQLVSPRGSRIVLYTVATGTRVAVAKSRIAVLAHPALTPVRIAWVDQRSGVTRLRRKAISRSTVGTLATITGRSVGMWTTATAGLTVYYTRWSASTGAAQIYRVTG